MALGAILGAALNTAAAHPFGLFVDGLDLIPPSATGRPSVPRDTISAPLAPEENDELYFEVWDPGKAFAPVGTEDVLFYDFNQNIPLFGGFITRAEKSPAFGTGRIWRVRAKNNDLLLDQLVVPGDAMPAGYSDQALVQHLIGSWGRSIQALSGTVALTKASMPAMAWAPMTLRAAIRQVADAAGAGRTFWLDEFRNLYYTLSSALTAPFVIHDVPTGAQIAANAISVELDASTTFDEVYVVGANAAGSGWVSNRTRTRPLARQAILENSDSDSPTKRDLYGLGYLASSGGAITSGTLSVEGSDGWLPGQVITITNAALGLTGAQYLIRTVEPEFKTGAGRRAYKITFGAIPRSLRRTLLTTLRQGQTTRRWT